MGNPFVESGRLDALRRTGLLDTAPEPEFDEVVRIAAAICNVPISLVSLIDQNRQWFKAALGMETRETSRDISFCDHAMRQPSVFVVEDAMRDPRFRNNPLVTGEPGIRFYAGVKFESPDGLPLGALCVIDRQPRTLTAEQASALTILARQVSAQIELRIQRRALEIALGEAEEARTKLALADRRFQAFLNNGPFIAYLKDSEGKYLTYNAAFARLFHITLSDWIGKTDEQVFPSHLAQAYRANDLKVIRTQTTQIEMEETLNGDGTTKCWRSYKFPCAAEDGSIWIGGMSLDVTDEIARERKLQSSSLELEAANQRLQELAATDPLTGLANRRVFAERLQLEFNRSRRKKVTLAVLVLDIDNFKRRNDTYGHDDGDAVLRRFADVLRHTVRETDMAARYGGEEFVVLLPEASESEAMGLAQRILEAIRAEHWAHEPVTVSIGASGLNAATPNPERMVTLADEALYAAKRTGKDRAVSYQAYYQQMLQNLNSRG